MSERQLVYQDNPLLAVLAANALPVIARCGQAADEQPMDPRQTGAQYSAQQALHDTLGGRVSDDHWQLL